MCSVRNSSTPRNIALGVRRALALAVLVATGSCSDGRRDAPIGGATIEGDRVLHVSIDACNADDNRVTVEESATAVIVTASTDDPLDGDACADSVSVTLDSPLGDRQVIDGTSSRLIDVAERP
jgi:hypothetical protein